MFAAQAILFALTALAAYLAWRGAWRAADHADEAELESDAAAVCRMHAERAVADAKTAASLSLEYAELAERHASEIAATTEEAMAGEWVLVKVPDVKTVKADTPVIIESAE